MKKIFILNNKGGCGKSTLTMSLADVLKGEVVDLDSQRTLTYSSQFTGRHIPVDQEKVTAEWIIYDTPPYRDGSLSSLLKHADYVLIPVLVGYPDLLATKPAIDLVIRLGLVDKATVVFNKVRRPYNKSYHTLKGFFAKNYAAVKAARTELSELKAFQDVLTEPLRGKALWQVKQLAQEIFRIN